MVSPTRFGFNEEAYLTNSFQNRVELSNDELQNKAKSEFDAFVQQLKDLQVDVLIYEDIPDSTTPDSIFPNNWFSTHVTGELFLYPMAVKNRRAERREHIIQDLVDSYGYSTTDLSHFETAEPPLFLEGTGSLILDHRNKVAYAALSPRTSQVVLDVFAQHLGYEVVSFEAYGKTGELIYHTNVMMATGDNYVIVGLDTIAEQNRVRVETKLRASGKELITLSNDQVYNAFAGNMLQIRNTKDETILVLSQKAMDALSEEQLDDFTRLNDHLLAIEIPTIEKVGGGSVRCMLAEIYDAG